MNLAIKSDSWLMAVARYGGLEDEGRSDLCSVTRAFLWGLTRAPFWVVLLGGLGSGLAFFLIVEPIIAVIAYLVAGLPFQDEVWAALALEAIAALFVYEVWAADEHKASPIGSTVRVAKTAYCGWKDKTCVLVEIT